MSLHFLNRSRPRLVPPQTPRSLERARAAVAHLDDGEWSPGLCALAEAWYLAVTHGERVSEKEAEQVMRAVVSRWWTPDGGDAA